MSLVSLKMTETNIYSELTTITPEAARELLDITIINRPLSERTVARYAKQIEKGQWDLNGESIKLSDTGKLVDGQHRLHAIVKANRAIQTLITYGLPEESFHTLDSGRRRTAGDVFAINHEKNYIAMAAGLKLFYIYQFIADGTINGFENPAYNPSIHDLVTLRQNHPEVVHSASVGIGMRNFIQPGMAIFCHLLFSQKNQVKADEFFQKLLEGIDLERRNPIRILRERLILDRGAQAKLLVTPKVAFIIKTWNYFRSGKCMRILKWEPSKELFPKPL